MERKCRDCEMFDGLCHSCYFEGLAPLAGSPEAMAPPEGAFGEDPNPVGYDESTNPSNGWRAPEMTRPRLTAPLFAYLNR